MKKTIPKAIEPSSGASRGRRWRTFGYVLLISASLMLLGTSAIHRMNRSPTPTNVPWEITAILQLLAFGLAVSGVKSLKHGKQIAVQSAEDILARDLRAPVVYLRSFQDDPLTARGTLDPAIGAGVLVVAGLFEQLNRLGGLTSEEEQLGEALREVGPFVAIGKPGEPLPQLGAARTYMANDEWQDKVRDLMERAALIVLRAGTTEGIGWEIKTALESASPQRAIILLPFDQKQYEIFRTRTEGYLKLRLPDYPRKWWNPAAGSVRAILYFDSDRRPHFQAVKLRFGALNLVPAFHTVLQPAFEQLHLKVAPPVQRLRNIMIIFVFSVVGLFILGLVAITFI
jgi:hypothetical protein